MCRAMGRGRSMGLPAHATARRRRLRRCGVFMTKPFLGKFSEAADLPRDWPPKSRNRKCGAGNGVEVHYVLLDHQDPMRSARELVAACFTDTKQRRLRHLHRGLFWRYNGSSYTFASDGDIRTVVWTFLDCARLEKKGHKPFKPNLNRVSNVLDALRSLCHLDTSIEPPTGPTALVRRRRVLSCRQRPIAFAERRLAATNPKLFWPRCLTGQGLCATLLHQSNGLHFWTVFLAVILKRSARCRNFLGTC